MIFFNLHTHKYTNQDGVIEIVNQYPNEFSDEIPHYSIGIHPWYITDERVSEDVNTIKKKLQLNERKMIGAPLTIDFQTMDDNQGFVYQILVSVQTR